MSLGGGKSLSELAVELREQTNASVYGPNHYMGENIRVLSYSDSPRSQNAQAEALQKAVVAGLKVLNDVNEEVVGCLGEKYMKRTITLIKD